MSVALTVGVLSAAGVYLLFQRGLVRLTLGFVLLGHAVNLLLMAAGGIGARGVPIAGEREGTADPLPQAFALTAIVITFGITAYLLALAVRARETSGDDDPEVRP